MSLGASSFAADSICPFQNGKVVGSKGGSHVERNVEWLVDSGAEIATIWNSVGAAFDASRAVGVTASPTTGGGGIQVVIGPVVQFSARDGTGNMRVLRAAGYIGIKSADTLNNLLGMQQLAQAGARLEWDPSKRTGQILL